MYTTATITSTAPTAKINAKDKPPPRASMALQIPLRVSKVSFRGLILDEGQHPPLFQRKP